MKKIQIIYNILISISTTIFIVGLIRVLLDYQSTFVRTISVWSAMFGTVLLFAFLIMKSMFFILKKVIIKLLTY